MTPRYPTPEERALWQESNRLNHVQPTLTNSTGGALDCFNDLVEKKTTQAALHPVAKTIPEPIRARSKKPTTPTAPLRPLPTREAMRLFKQHPVDATLDLHGLTKLDAYGQVQHFIAQQTRTGRRHLIIITGKGKGGEVGVLRSHLPHWLNEPPLRPLISAFASARPEKGGAGVTHVLLKSR